MAQMYLQGELVCTDFPKPSLMNMLQERGTLLDCLQLPSYHACCWTLARRSQSMLLPSSKRCSCRKHKKLVQHLGDGSPFAANGCKASVNLRSETCRCTAMTMLLDCNLLELWTQLSEAKTLKSASSSSLGHVSLLLLSSFVLQYVQQGP